MLKFIRRINLIFGLLELLAVQLLKSEREQQDQKIEALTKEVEDAKAYRRHVIEGIIKNKVAIGCIPDEAIAETARRLDECPYDELKRLHWNYKLRTVMMDKHGNA